MSTATPLRTMSAVNEHNGTTKHHGITSTASASSPPPPSPPPPSASSSSSPSGSTAQHRPQPAYSSPFPANKRHRGSVMHPKDVTQFIACVQRACQDRPGVYNHFLCLLQNYRSSGLDHRAAGMERYVVGIQELFADQPALLADLDLFLPSHLSVFDPVKPAEPPAAARHVTTGKESDEDDDVQVTGMQESAFATHWRCAACSWLNHRSLADRHCEMCFTPKQKQQTARTAQPQPAIVPAISVSTSSSPPVPSIVTPAAASANPVTAAVVLSSSLDGSSSTSIAVSSSVSPSPLSALAVLADTSTSITAGERKTDYSSEQDPPAPYRPLVGCIADVEKAMSALRHQLSLSHSLASPPPTTPSGEQRSITATRQLCTEVTSQLAISSHLLLAFDSSTEAVDAVKEQITQLKQQQSGRHAVLLSTFTQLTHNPLMSQSTETEGRAAKTAKHKRRQMCDEDEEAEDEQEAEAEAEAEADVNTCPICFNDKNDALLQPCGHASCCAHCAKELKRSKKSCPRCHKRIRTIVAITL